MYTQARLPLYVSPNAYSCVVSPRLLFMSLFAVWLQFRLLKRKYVRRHSVLLVSAGATLPRVLGTNVNLSNVDFKRRDLSNHDLSGANLSGANLSGVNLSGANLSGANFTGHVASFSCYFNTRVSHSG